LAACSATAIGICSGRGVVFAQPATVAAAPRSSIRLSIAFQVPTDREGEANVSFSLRPISKSTAQSSKPIVLETGASRAELVPVKGPGSYVLQMNGFGERINFALTLVEGYRCELTFLPGRGDGGVLVTQLACSADGSARETAFRRSFSDLQLALQDGRTPANIILARLSDWKYSDPVALAVETHLRSHQNDQAAFRKAAERLAAEHSRLPDGHVALARTHEMSAQSDHESASASYARALELGLPILTPFLEMLWVGVRRYEIKHDRVGLLERVFRSRVTGMLWSAWNPDLA
jgi:hypothetical protein